MNQSNTGVPAHHIAGTNFIMVHLDLVDDLDGDFHAAMLLDRIRFRAGSGWWTATQADLTADTRLSEHQVRRALKHLREAGYIESKRVSPYDPTQKFRVIVCEECAETTETTVNAESSVTRIEKSTAVTENIQDTRRRNLHSLPLSKNSKELGIRRPPAKPRDDVEHLCQLLADKIEENGSNRPTVTKSWRDAARLMLDKDGRPYDHIVGAINWCQNDDFWRGNIMSMPTLRKQYDRLRLAAQRGQKRSNTQGWLALLAESMDNSPQGYPQVEG